MLKSLPKHLAASNVETTDDLGIFTREYSISRRIGIWQMWTAIMAFTAIFLAAAILTMV